MGMMQEFRDFAVKGNVVDLAVGVIIGAAFGKITTSLVEDIVMPLVGKIFGDMDFSNMFIQLGNLPDDFKGSAASLADLKAAGVSVLAYGNFITVLINFLILAFIIFQMVRAYNKMKEKAIKEEEAAPEEPAEDTVLLREIRDALKK